MSEALLVCLDVGLSDFLKGIDADVLFYRSVGLILKRSIKTWKASGKLGSRYGLGQMKIGMWVWEFFFFKYEIKKKV